MTTIGTIITDEPICDYEQLASWEGYDLKELEPSKEFEDFEPKVIEALINSIQSRLIIKQVELDEDDNDYGNAFYYTFSY